MKKRTSFFFCLLIILAAGAFAFYTGWSQFKVEPGNVGILFSKTSGVNPAPITHDKFSWNWELLLPTNAKLMEFSQKPYTFEKKVEGVFPSGKEYAKVFNGAADFSYWYNFSITLSCTADQIMELVKSKEIASQEDLEKYLDRNAQIVCNNAAAALVEGIFKNESSHNISAIIKSATDGCKNCDVDSATISSSSVPDVELYLRAKASYDDYIAKLEAAAQEAAKHEAEDASRFNTTIKKMESLGETLKKYPELSDVIKNSDNVTKVLDKIDSIN